jgi:hypothetical protein
MTEKTLPFLEEVAWLDLVNATFETNGTHYSVSFSLNGGYHSNLTLYVYLEINGTEVGLINTFFHVRIIGFNSYVQCQNALGIYADSGIAMLSANMVTWTFPQENITNIIKNVRPISEWKVLVH